MRKKSLGINFVLKQEQSSAQLQSGEKHPLMGAVNQKKLWGSTKSF